MVVRDRFHCTVYRQQTWSDPFLAWDPAEYDGTPFVELSAEDIWIPLVGLRNRYIHRAFLNYFPTRNIFGLFCPVKCLPHVLIWSMLCIFVGEGRCFNSGLPWWRHDTETLFASLALCEGNPLITPVVSRIKGRLCMVLIYPLLVVWKPVEKQWWCRWFETPWAKL